MNFVSIEPEPIRHLPVESQQNLLWQETERVDKVLPLKAVINVRRQAATDTGNLYSSIYDEIMWQRVGNPYETLTPNGLRLFSAISNNGEIVHVELRRGEYSVNTANLLTGEYREWHIHEAKKGPAMGSLDLELIIGKTALSLVKEKPTSLKFLYPSMNEGTIREAGQPTIYSRCFLRNLYTVVKAFDEKYGHLEVLYKPQPETLQPEPPAVMMSA